MTSRMQQRLALAAAAALIVIVLAANLHLVRVAFRSQPGCMAVAGAPAPAWHSCQEGPADA
jgi:hypothetical protein